MDHIVVQYKQFWQSSHLSSTAVAERVTEYIWKRNILSGLHTHIRLTAFFQDNLGKPSPEHTHTHTQAGTRKVNHSDFTDARDDGMAVASAGPYANHLHHTPDRYPRQYPITQFFTCQMLFLTPNQQCPSTEGRALKAVA